MSRQIHTTATRVLERERARISDYKIQLMIIEDLAIRIFVACVEAKW